LTRLELFRILYIEIRETPNKGKKMEIIGYKYVDIMDLADEETLAHLGMLQLEFDFVEDVEIEATDIDFQ